MSHSTNDTYKTKGYDNDHYYHDEQCSPRIMEPCTLPVVSWIPTTTGHSSPNVTPSTKRTSGPWDYPGNRRLRLPASSSSSSSLSASTVLVRTAGNALQAVPATFLPPGPLLFMQVTVPSRAQAGDTIHVRSPYPTTNDEEVLIAATIPNGLVPGQTFHVTCPTTAVAVQDDADDAAKNSPGEWWRW